MADLINHPSLWRAQLPLPNAHSHKYSRGCALVFGGLMTGAGRLAARAAQRVGAGLVQVGVPAEVMPIYAHSLMSCIIRTEPDDVLLSDERVSAYLIGPGLLPDERARQRVRAVLATGRPTVLDAGALSCFAGRADELLAAVHAHTVLTPHGGEYARLFGERPLSEVATTAVIVLKGAVTRIASPAGQIVNEDAPADLASGGTGDVLAGLITGLLAQGMPPFQAAAAGVWLQTEAARRVGAGLIAEDLEGQIPAIMSELRKLTP